MTTFFIFEAEYGSQTAVTKESPSSIPPHSHPLFHLSCDERRLQAMLRTDQAALKAI